MTTTRAKDEPRPAAARFLRIDTERATLRERLAAAQAEQTTCEAAVARERTEYRVALARAAADAPVSRGALDAAERALAAAGDLVAGCEEALRRLEPDWKRAKVEMLQEENAEIGAQMLAAEQALARLRTETEALRRQEGIVGQTIIQLSSQRTARAGEIQQLLQELHAAAHGR